MKRRLFLVIPVSPLDTGVHLSDLSKKVGPPQQIAKAAASGSQVFVTEDRRIVDNASSIERLVGIRVATPVSLALEFHQRLNTKTYHMRQLSGNDFTIRRLGAGDLDDTIGVFRRDGERKGLFRLKLQSYLACPDQYECNVVTIQNNQVGLVVRSKEEDRILAVHLLRTARAKARRYPVTEFLIADSLTACVSRRMRGVRFEPDELDGFAKGRLLEAGFVPADGGYFRPCISRTVSRPDLLDLIRTVAPTALDHYAQLSTTELAMSCAPVQLLGHEETNVIIPIKPGYAMSLFDRQAASDDMFGGRPEVLMRLANVYFRKKTHHRVLTAPARIFWYESGRVGAITAVSWLEEVESGTAKSLFRRYRRFGTLDWQDLYKMCDGNPDRHIMALRFSQTFSFLQSLPLSTLRTIEGRRDVPLQSPRLIGIDVADRIYQAGFPNG